jgi:TPP-dependent pyruvate/acetoin dehydrogenase alpha subunit
MKCFLPVITMLALCSCDLSREEEEAAKKEEEAAAVRERARAAEATPAPKPGDWMRDYKGPLDKKPEKKKN